MIIGVGVDAVEIARFALWYTKSRASLRRIFSDEEIEYCLQDINRSAERFAVRFAAREAIYKVMSSSMPVSSRPIPFLTVAGAITIRKNVSGSPIILFDCQRLEGLGIDHLIGAYWYLSLTHTKTIAIASAIGENQSGSAKLI